MNIKNKTILPMKMLPVRVNNDNNIIQTNYFTALLD